VLERKLKKLFWSFAEGHIHGRSTVDPLGISSSILILRPDRLGDFLLSAPAIQAIEKKAGPSAKLTIVAGTRNAAVARAHFPKAQVLVFRSFFLAKLSLFARLWFGRFDAVIDFHSYPFSTTSALMSLFSGTHRRIGFLADGDFREYRQLSQKVYNWSALTPTENLHESQKGFRLARKLYPGISNKTFLSVPSVPQGTLRAVNDFYKKFGISGKTKMVGLHPTLQKADNRWSQERYLELVGKLGAVPGLKIILVHGQGEGNELKRFQEALGDVPNLFVLPSDDIFFILEAAKRFRAFVCNDSGLMHLATGVTNLFAVFGPSDPRRWGPLPAKGFKHRIFRKKDGLCDSVQVSEVLRKVFEVLR